MATAGSYTCQNGFDQATANIVVLSKFQYSVHVHTSRYSVERPHCVLKERKKIRQLIAYGGLIAYAILGIRLLIECRYCKVRLEIEAKTSSLLQRHINAVQVFTSYLINNINVVKNQGMSSKPHHLCAYNIHRLPKYCHLRSLMIVMQKGK